MQHKNKKVGAWILIVVGGIFFLKNFVSIDILANINWNYIWPLILIFLGARRLQS